MKSFGRFVVEIFGEPADASFTHEDHEYDLNGLLSATVGRQPEDVPVSQLKWIMRYDPMGPDDVERIANADLSAPCLIIQEPLEHDRWVVLDGMHRLVKAVRSNVPYLPCIKVSSELLDRYRINQ